MSVRWSREVGDLVTFPWNFYGVDDVKLALLEISFVTVRFYFFKVARFAAQLSPERIKKITTIKLEFKRETKVRERR